MKILKVIINVLTTLIIVVGGFLIAIYVVGIKPYVVLSGSMEPTIKVGDLCFINTHKKYENIKEKDIIAFKMNDETLVTHRVVSITDDGMETKGDANENKDGSIVTKKEYVGENVFKIPKVGTVVKVIQTTKGKIIFGTFIIILFIAGLLLGDNDKNKSKKKEKKD